MKWTQLALFQSAPAAPIVPSTRAQERTRRPRYHRNEVVPGADRYAAVGHYRIVVLSGEGWMGPAPHASASYGDTWKATAREAAQIFMRVRVYNRVRCCIWDSLDEEGK